MCYMFSKVERQQKVQTTLKPLSGYQRSLEPLVIKNTRYLSLHVHVLSEVQSICLIHHSRLLTHSIVLYEEISLSSASLASCMVFLDDA